MNALTTRKIKDLMRGSIIRDTITLRLTAMVTKYVVALLILTAAVRPEAVALVKAASLEMVVLTTRLAAVTIVLLNALVIEVAAVKPTEVAIVRPHDFVTLAATVKPTAMVARYWFIWSVTILTLATNPEAVALVHATVLEIEVAAVSPTDVVMCLPKDFATDTAAVKPDAVVIVHPLILLMAAATVNPELVTLVAAHVLETLTAAVRPTANCIV